MSDQLKRRDLMKAAAAGGFFALGAGAADAAGGAEAAQPPNAGAWAGEWLLEGRPDQPCAVFQHGRVLLLVNELLHLAVGRVVGFRRIVVTDALTWSDKSQGNGMAGALSADGLTILWENRSTWRRG
jgi:hypothetical protein